MFQAVFLLHRQPVIRSKKIVPNLTFLFSHSIRKTFNTIFVDGSSAGDIWRLQKYHDDMLLKYHDENFTLKGHSTTRNIFMFE